MLEKLQSASWWRSSEYQTVMERNQKFQFEITKDKKIKFQKILIPEQKDERLLQWVQMPSREKVIRELGIPNDGMNHTKAELLEMWKKKKVPLRDQELFRLKMMLELGTRKQLQAEERRSLYADCLHRAFWAEMERLHKKKRGNYKVMREYAKSQAKKREEEALLAEEAKANEMAILEEDGSMRKSSSKVESGRSGGASASSRKKSSALSKLSVTPNSSVPSTPGSSNANYPGQQSANAAANKKEREEREKEEQKERERKEAEDELMEKLADMHCSDDEFGSGHSGPMEFEEDIRAEKAEFESQFLNDLDDLDGGTPLPPGTPGAGTPGGMMRRSSTMADRDEMARLQGVVKTHGEGEDDWMGYYDANGQWVPTGPQIIGVEADGVTPIYSTVDGGEGSPTGQWGAGQQQWGQLGNMTRDSAYSASSGTSTGRGQRQSRISQSQSENEGAWGARWSDSEPFNSNNNLNNNSRVSAGSAGMNNMNQIPAVYGPPEDDDDQLDDPMSSSEDEDHSGMRRRDIHKKTVKMLKVSILEKPEAAQNAERFQQRGGYGGLQLDRQFRFIFGEANIEAYKKRQEREDDLR
jgi:hypothetical protein